MNELGKTTEKINWFKLTGKILLWFFIIFIVTLLADLIIGLGIASTLLKLILPDSPARETALFYITFTGTWTVLPLFIYFRKKDRPILKALGTKASGNNLKGFLLGLVIGGGMNGFCALVAWLNHDIELYFDSFRPLSFLLVFLCVFIQSSAEELTCRGYLYQKFIKLSGKPVVAIIASSVYFGIMHLLNSNITVLSVVNLMSTGVFYALMVYYMDSIWCPMAAHAAWNFTQNILLGLPNSGNVVPYSVFKIDAASAVSGFAYNVGFGIEGGILATLLNIIGCIVLVVWGRKHGRKPLDVWEEAAEPDTQSA